MTPVATAVPIGPMSSTSETVKTRFSTRLKARYVVSIPARPQPRQIAVPGPVSITAVALPVMSIQSKSVTSGIGCPIQRTTRRSANPATTTTTNPVRIDTMPISRL